MRVLRSILFCGLLIGTGSGCALLMDTPVEESPQYKTPSALYEKAMDYFQRGQYAKAKELFHLYIEQYPDSLSFKVVLYDLARCYQMLGDDKEALALYNRVVTTYGDQDFWGEQAMKRIKQMRSE